MLLLQVVLSRVFVGLIYNELYYFPLSMAMLGLCGGGVLLYAFEDRFTGDAAQLAKRSIHRAFWAALLFALGVLALNAYTRAEVEPALIAAAEAGEDFEPLFFASRIPLLVLYGAASVLPFYFLGLAIAALLRGYAQIVNTIYFFDLAGATLGAVLALPVLLYFESANYLLASPLLIAVALAVWDRRAGAYLAALLAVGAAIQLSKAPSLESTTLRALGALPGFGVVQTQWTPTSYLQLLEADPGRWRILQDHHATVRGRKFRERKRGCIQAADPCPEAPWMMFVSVIRGRPQSVCVLAAGVGSQMIDAHHSGVAEIVGVEMNPTLLPFFASRVPDARLEGLVSAPGVHYVVDEARHFLRTTRRRFDLILIPPFGSARGTAAPSSPNHMLTEEAISEYLERLSDEGMLALTLRAPWNSANPGSLSRMLLLIRRGLERAGAAHPEQHVAAFRPGFVFVSKRPFEPEERQLASLAAKSLGVRPRTLADLEAQLEPPRRAVTDDYPFWQGASSFERLATDLAWLWPPYEEPASGENVLLLTVVLGLLLVLAVILFPLVRIARGSEHFAKEDWLAIGYFTCLGAGFMFVEVPLMEKLVFTLGHPIYSISFCLAVLLASTGLGSLLSGRILWRAGVLRRRAFVAAFALLIGAQGALYAGLQPLLVATTTLPTTLAIGSIGLAIVPLGLLLGVPFPQGLALLRESGRTSLIPWAWGVNGAASVLAINLSVVLTRIVGISPMFLLATLLYLLALATLRPALLRPGSS